MSTKNSTKPRFFTYDGAPHYLSHRAVLYERRAVTDVWNKVTHVANKQWKWKNVDSKDDEKWYDAEPRILQIRGPPGNGKSSAVYYWVYQTVKSLGTGALWISCATVNGRCWTLERNQSDGSSVHATEGPVPLGKDDVVDAASIVVFDGVRATTLETWRGLMNDLARRGILVLVVSSEVVTFHAGDSQDILKLEHFVPSWQKDEYVEACKNEEFWKRNFKKLPGATARDSEIRRLKLIEEKFRVAGHSARFMFKESVTSIESVLGSKALTMGGIDSLEAAVKADRSVGAVDSLVARLSETKNGPTPAEEAVFPTQESFDAVAERVEDFSECDEDHDTSESRPCLVSAVATDKVIRELPTDVERLRHVARKLDNQAIEGYALEEQLKKKLLQASQPGNHLTLGIGRAYVQYRVSKLIVCSTSNEVIDALRKNQPPDTWIFIAGHQGAFDAIHLETDQSETDRRIRFVQITAGRSHTFKLGIIDSMMQTLAIGPTSMRWSHLEFMILRPEDDNRKFDLKKAEGGLQSYKRFDGTEWDRTDYRKNVQHATLGWEY